MRNVKGNLMSRITFELLTFLLLLCGCSSPYQLTADDYMAAAPNIKLGWSKDEVIELLKIARKHRKEAYRKFWVVELENGDMVLKTDNAIRKQNIPQQAIVGNLKDLYNEFVLEKGRGINDRFFDDEKNAGI